MKSPLVGGEVPLTDPVVDSQGVLLPSWEGWLNRLDQTIRKIPGPVIHLAKTSLVDDLGGAAGTKVQIRWDSELRKDKAFSHSNSTNPSRITVATDARYRITASVSALQGGAARTTLMLYVRLDGTTEITRCVARNYSRGSAFGDISNNIVTELQLTRGQYIEIQSEVDQTDASYTINTIAAQCECIIQRIER